MKMNKEILYRAINDNDLKDIDSNIKCSLIKSLEINPSSIVKLYNELCINNFGEYALDTIAGHIAGGRLKSGLSPWISTSSDFEFVCTEYAIPQSGVYNESPKRKPIIILEVENVLKSPEDIKYYRDKKMPDNMIIDLRNGNLNNLYNNAFLSETYNSRMPGYNFFKDAKRNIFNLDINVKGLSNYASYANEVLIYKQINKDYIKLVLFPLLQDIIYGCNINVNDNLEFLKDNIDNITNIIELSIKNISIVDKSIFSLFYDSIENANNLTDILYDNYDLINKDDIYSKYLNLLVLKKYILDKIITNINANLKTNYKLSRLIDDNILVFDLNNPITINEKMINDIILVKKDNILYKYDSKEKKYVNKNKCIYKNDIIKVLKKKK